MRSAASAITYTSCMQSGSSYEITASSNQAWSGLVLNTPTVSACLTQVFEALQ
jgi:hypothetical protein